MLEEVDTAAAKSGIRQHWWHPTTRHALRDKDKHSLFVPVLFQTAGLPSQLGELCGLN